jgi:hypothetical protein
MSLPFAADQFFAVFAAYNSAVWPAQVVAYVLGLLALALAWRAGPVRSRVVAGVLGVFWLWIGIAYQILYFSPINPAAWVFGALFAAQGLLFLYLGSLRGRLRFAFAPSLAPVAGAVLILYAMVGYPLLGAALGHHYPAAPTFGVTPCPSTIFTFGLLLWAAAPLPRYLLVIPVLWAIIGTSAAIQLDVVADYGLGAAALIAVALLLRPRHPRRVQAPRAA